MPSAANSQPVSGSGDIARVGAISSSDEHIGKLIAEAMEKVSQNGVITVEESKTAETYSEVVEGMQFDRGYVTPYMVTDNEKMEAVIDDALILITDKKISNIQEILPAARADCAGRQEAASSSPRTSRARRWPPSSSTSCAARSPACASRPPASATAARKCCRISPS